MIAVDGRFFRADLDGQVNAVDPGRGRRSRFSSGSRRRSSSSSTDPLPTHALEPVSSMPTSPMEPPRAPFGSTARSRRSGRARSRARLLPTGRSARWSQSSTSSSSRTSRARWSGFAFPSTARGSRSAATTSTSSRPTAPGAATCSSAVHGASGPDRRLDGTPPRAATRGGLSPLRALSRETHEVLARVEGSG